ncbi:MAG: AAA family ATP:ADP antiporter [Sulfurimonas sp.]
MRFLKAFKSIEQDEFLPLVLLFLHSFLNGIALVLFEATANTLFLMKYDITTLPYVYILTAFISVISGYFYTKLEDSISITKLLRITMLFVIFVISFFLILIKFNNSEFSYMGIMVSKDLVWMFIGMEFGILAGMIFNIRQGKRLFALLMSGEILAGILGGLSISMILNYMGTIDLLFISVIALAISFTLLNYILNRYAHRFKEEKVEEDLEDSTLSYKAMFRNKYYVLFFVISALSFFVFYFIDYLFYYYVEAKFTNEKELASFFGVFYAVLNIVNLFSSLFIAGAMLSRYGVIFGILAIPLLGLIGISSLYVTTMFSLGIAFIILVLIKLLDEVLDISILSPTFKVLYQSIPSSQRMKVMAFRETIIEPVAMGLTGLILLGISIFEGLELVYFIIIFTSIVWMALGKMLKEHYVLSLDKLLNQREVFQGEFALDDIDIRVFTNGVKSSNELEVIYCLDALVKIKHKDIDAIFKTLLSHNSVKVRLSVLQYLDKLEKDNLCNDLSLAIEIEQNPEVLSRSLKLYSKLDALDAIEKLSQYIHNDNHQIQEGAIVGLIQFGGIDGILIGGEVLNKLLASKIKTEKMLALNILSNMNVASFYKQLKELLHYDDYEIKSITITIVGNLKIKKLIPDILINLESDEYRNTTVGSLIKFESGIFNELSKYFKETKHLKNKLALVKVFSKMKSDEAHNFLLQYTNEPLFCDEILQRLFNNNYLTSNKNLLEKLISSEVDKTLFYLDISSLLNEETFPNSCLVVNELISKKIENIFFILGFTHPKEMILKASINYKSDSKDSRAYTVEVIDNILDKNTKKMVLPILEDIAVEKKFLNYLYTPHTDESQLINKLLIDDSFALILRLSLIFEIGKNRNKIYLEKIEELLNNENNDIKETSIWTIMQLQKG